MWPLAIYLYLAQRVIISVTTHSYNPDSPPPVYLLSDFHTLIFPHTKEVTGEIYFLVKFLSLFPCFLVLLPVENCISVFLLICQNFKLALL